MVGDIFSGVISYVERLDNLTPMEYGVIATLAVALVCLAIVLRKIYWQVKFYLYRKSQLDGWRANHGRMT